MTTTTTTTASVPANLVMEQPRICHHSPGRQSINPLHAPGMQTETAVSAEYNNSISCGPSSCPSSSAVPSSSGLYLPAESARTMPTSVDSATAATLKGRTLVLCFDGTSNQYDGAVSDLPSPISSFVQHQPRTQTSSSSTLSSRKTLQISNCVITRCVTSIYPSTVLRLISYKKAWYRYLLPARCCRACLPMVCKNTRRGRGMVRSSMIP
jgi:hypothetical protein